MKRRDLPLISSLVTRDPVGHREAGAATAALLSQSFGAEATCPLVEVAAGSGAPGMDGARALTERAADLLSSHRRKARRKYRSELLLAIAVRYTEKNMADLAWVSVRWSPETLETDANRSASASMKTPVKARRRLRDTLEEFQGPIEGITFTRPLTKLDFRIDRIRRNAENVIVAGSLA